MTTIAILFVTGLCFFSLYMMERPATVGEGLVSIKEEVQ